MSKIKVAVVEDEALIAIRLCGALEDLGYQVFDSVANYTEAIELISSAHPDILITDIQLSGRKSGIDLARKVREFSNIPIIFLTSHSDKETIDDARNARPNAYLIKPFNKEELYSAIEIAIMNHRPSESVTKELRFHFIKAKDSYEKVYEDDILYVKSDHVYIEIFTTSNHKYVVRKSLLEFLDELGSDFLRVHKSFILNFRHVTKVTSNSVFIGDQEFPIGKSFKSDLFEAINFKQN